MKRSIRTFRIAGSVGITTRLRPFDGLQHYLRPKYQIVKTASLWVKKSETSIREGRDAHSETDQSAQRAHPKRGEYIEYGRGEDRQ